MALSLIAPMHARRVPHVVLRQESECLARLHALGDAFEEDAECMNQRTPSPRPAYWRQYELPSSRRARGGVVPGTHA